MFPFGERMVHHWTSVLANSVSCRKGKGGGREGGSRDNYRDREL